MFPPLPTQTTARQAALCGAEFLNNMWEINSKEQIITFLLSICFGAAYSVIYDLFKSARAVHRHGKAALFLEDILFSVICTFLTFCLCILRTKGQPRAFLLFGVALGFCVLRYLLSDFLVLVFSSVFKAAIKIKNIIFGFLKAAFSKIGVKTAEILKKFYKTLKKGLKGVKRLLYNLFDKINYKKQDDIND